MRYVCFCVVLLCCPAPELLAQQVDFARDIQATLARRCFSCHGPDTQEGGLRFDDRKSLLAEADSGLAAIVPGDPAASELMRRIKTEDESERMPPEGEPLGESVLGTPPAWFGGMSEAGARWPWMATVLGLVSVATLVSGSLARIAPRARRIPDAAVELTEPVVHARGITKRYGQTTVLDGFDLEIQPGEGVALWGPNGSGKTTALKCLLGLARAGGEVAIAGIDLRRDGRAARAQTGYVPQVLDLPDLPLRELMMFIARVRGASPTRVEQMLEVVGLALPGNGSTLATAAARKGLFEQAGRLVVELCRRYYDQDDASVLPRAIVTREAIANLDLAIDERRKRLISYAGERGLAAEELPPLAPDSYPPCPIAIDGAADEHVAWVQGLDEDAAEALRAWLAGIVADACAA